MEEQNNINKQELETLKKNPFKYFLEAFLIPFKKGYFVNTYELLVLSAFLFWLPFGGILVDSLIASCAVIFFRRYIFKKEDVSIFEYFLKMLPFIITATGINFLFQIFLFFEKVGTNNRTLIHWFMLLISLNGIDFSSMFVKVLLLKVAFVFLFSGFFIVFCIKKHPYFQAIDIKKVYEIFSRRFISLLLATLPYIVISIILIYTMNALHVFYKPKDSAVYIALLFSIINIYLLLVTSILWAKTYLVKIEYGINALNKAKIQEKGKKIYNKKHILILSIILGVLILMTVFIYKKPSVYKTKNMGQWESISPKFGTQVIAPVLNNKLLMINSLNGSAFLYDLKTHEYERIERKNTERKDFLAVPLKDGRVLIFSYIIDDSKTSPFVEYFDSKNKKFYQLGELPFIISDSNSPIFVDKNGTVFIAGLIHTVIQNDNRNYALIKNPDDIKSFNLIKFNPKTNQFIVATEFPYNPFLARFNPHSFIKDDKLVLYFGFNIHDARLYYTIYDIEQNKFIKYEEFLLFKDEYKCNSNSEETMYCAFIDFENILILKNNFNDKQGFYAEIYNINTKKRTPVINKNKYLYFYRKPSSRVGYCYSGIHFPHICVLNNKNVLIAPMIKQKHQTFLLYKKDTNELVSVNNFPYSIGQNKYIQISDSTVLFKQLNDKDYLLYSFVGCKK